MRIINSRACNSAGTFSGLTRFATKENRIFNRTPRNITQRRRNWQKSASKAKPHLLIIYHASIVLRPALRPAASSPDQLLKEVLAGYAGEVVVGRDLDVY